MRAATATLWKALVPVLTVLLGASVAPGSGAERVDTVRRVRFEYRAEIPVAPWAHRVEAWIPLPYDDAFQQVRLLSITSPVQHEIVDQPHSHNRVVHLLTLAPPTNPIPVTIVFSVTRREEAPHLERAAADTDDGERSLSLAPDRLVPTGGRIAQIAAKLTQHAATPYERARLIYEYVVSTMKYDKSGTGWGRGDVLWACDVRRGNCTDFHSLFIALARASGIPARFTIGFPLGPNASGEIPGYHCWAEFWRGGEWVPVDASEAWQNPARHDYYLGHLDADRVGFTTGRDLQLTPPQHGEPLNYLIYPYVEIDGVAKPQNFAKTHFAYADLASPTHAIR